MKQVFILMLLLFGACTEKTHQKIYEIRLIGTDSIFKCEYYNHNACGISAIHCDDDDKALSCLNSVEIRKIKP